MCEEFNLIKVYLKTNTDAKIFIKIFLRIQILNTENLAFVEIADLVNP